VAEAGSDHGMIIGNKYVCHTPSSTFKGHPVG